MIQVKLTMYLVSLAPRVNNYLIQIIVENNFAKVEMCIEGTYTRQSQSYHILKKPRSLTLVLDSFVPSAINSYSTERTGASAVQAVFQYKKVIQTIHTCN